MDNNTREMLLGMRREVCDKGNWLLCWELPLRHVKLDLYFVTQQCRLQNILVSLLACCYCGKVYIRLLTLDRLEDILSPTFPALFRFPFLYWSLKFSLPHLFTDVEIVSLSSFISLIFSLTVLLYF